MISNRGVMVWPNGHPDTYKVDHWRCRFEGSGTVVSVLQRLAQSGVDVIKTENLYDFDGVAGYSKGQGQ